MDWISAFIGFAAGFLITVFIDKYGIEAVLKREYWKGYDNAILDVTKFGYYYDHDDNEIPIKVL